MLRIGEYELIKKIGSGGMAQVWLARKPVLGGRYQSVAIKRLSAHLQDDAAYKRMFVREASIATALSDPRIVTVHDAREVAGEAIIVMEWIKGPNLSRLMRSVEGRGEVLPARVSIHIVAEILRGLDYAHTVILETGSRGVIHKDISPSNVLLTDSGDVKIADFGISRLVSEDTTGSVKGKLHYIAPEQFAGNTDIRSDLYSVGVIFHELMSGKRFRDAKTDTHLQGQVMGAVETGIPEIPQARLPPALEAFRRALLAPRVSDRAASAEAALDLLRKSPLYGDGSFELRKLVRDLEGIDGPRSGIHAVAQMSAAAWMSSARESATSPAASLSPSAPHAADTVDRDAATKTSVDSVPNVSTPSSASTVPIMASGQQARVRDRPSRAGWVWPAAILVGALAGALVVSVLKTPAAGQAEPEARGQGIAAAEPESIAQVEADTARSELASSAPAERPDEPAKAAAPLAVPETEVDAHLVPDVKEAPEVKTSAQPEPEAKPEAKSEAKPEAETKAKPKAPEKLAPVQVTLHAGDFAWGRVKVDGRSYLVEPQRQVKLSPGRHRVAFSESLQGDFSSAGSVVVPKSGRHRLRILKGPLRAVLTRND